MEEKKKLSVFALVKNIVALFFLIWSLFMPVEELGSMFIMHYSIILAVFSGAADDSTMVFGVFDMIYAVLLVISLIFVIVNIVAALRGLKDPDGVTFRKMKRSFGFVLLLLTCVLNVISQTLFYISLLTAYPLGAFGFIFMFVLLVAVIVLSGIGMKKTRKVFADEIPVSKK